MPTKTKIPLIRSERWGRYPVTRDYPILGAIILVATFFCFNGLDKPGLWLDEVSYTIAAQRPIIDQITNSTATLGDYLSVDPTLSAIPFSLALKLGFSNFLARFPAALFGILNVTLIYRLGRKLFGNTTGLVAALLLCTSSFYLLYAQEARSYAQFIFFCMASFLFLYRATLRNNWRTWGSYGLCAWIGVSTNHLMLFAIAVQAVFLLATCLPNLLFKKNRAATVRTSIRFLGYFSISLLIVFILRVPWWEDFTQRQCAGCDIGNPTYGLDVAASAIRSLQAFTRATPLMTSMLIALHLLGLILALYHFPKHGLMLACWLTGSILITTFGLWFISQFFHERYTIWGLPAFFLTVAYGLVSIAAFIDRLLLNSNPGLTSSRLGKMVQVTVIGLLLIPISIAGLAEAKQNPTIKQAWPLGQVQEVADKIASEATHNETVITIGMPARQLQFYLDHKRQDLIYLDENSFPQRAATGSLPQTFNGRWYVIHNPIYTSFNTPEILASLDYVMFHDILVIHDPDVCQLKDCLLETATFLPEIAAANPGSRLAERINGVLKGLNLLILKYK